VASVLALVFAFEGVVIARSQALPIGSDAVFLALMHLNVIGIGLLAWLLSRNVVKLVIDRRQGIVGAKLNTKFVSSFVFTAALSTTGLFILSSFLVAHTIDTWFESELADGLDQAVAIADEYFKEPEARTRTLARELARELAESQWVEADANALVSWIEQRQAQHELRSLEVLDAKGERVAGGGTFAEFAANEGGESPTQLPSLESRPLVAAALAGEARGERQLQQGGDTLRSAAPIQTPDGNIQGVVVVQRFLPGAMGQRANSVRAALEAFQRLEPSAGSFESSMLLLLGMLTLVSVLFSSWMGFRLAKQVTDPIQRLAEATHELAAGNLAVRVEQRGQDELGSLVGAFNRMADDLQASRNDLERRRGLMEVVLGGVGAGVISIDAQEGITTVNPSAARLLGVSPRELVGRKLCELPGGGDAVAALEGLVARLRNETSDILRSQGTVSIGQEHRVLHWTVSRLRDREERHAGAVVLIDDVTQIVRGQRTAAWRDVARRMAHEIKNPLTPIQLSAQRLRRKLGSTLADPDSKSVLEQCTEAITGQVEAMKHLLSEFSSFADLPATDPAPTNLNQLVSEAVAMYRGKASISFVEDLAKELPELDLDREQIKRVILNLIDNAIVAVEAADSGPREIAIATRFDQALETVHLEVADTGCGIQPADRVRLFQPGFSTKKDGTGIGLSIVSRIVSDHCGYIRVRSNPPRGTRFVVELPVRPV